MKGLCSITMVCDSCDEVRASRCDVLPPGPHHRFIRQPDGQLDRAAHQAGEDSLRGAADAGAQIAGAILEEAGEVRFGAGITRAPRRAPTYVEEGEVGVPALPVWGVVGGRPEVRDEDE
jgi:hypothetical protein